MHSNIIEQSTNDMLGLPTNPLRYLDCSGF